MSEWGYICHGCQSEVIDAPDGAESVNIDKTRTVNGGKETAETLARIHRIKTGHDPVVKEM